MSSAQHPRDAAVKIISVLRSNGHEALFAGGCVRDELLGRAPKDYDVATSARPEVVEALFPKTIAIGKAFGVIGVIDGNLTTEVATFRKDIGIADGRRPESVHFCAAREDALRRDFTINGMFYDPLEEKLIDYVGGQRDLEKCRIVAIGNPAERFREDHLRMLRAVRFMHTLGFEIDEATDRAIQEMAHLIQRISAERIENELTRTLTESARPGDALRHLACSGLLEYILPEILPMIGQEQPPQFHPEGDVFEHTVLMLNSMNGQAGMPAPRSALHEDRQAGMPTPHSQTPNPVEQASLPAQTKHHNPVERASLPAHPDDVLALHPFRPVEQSESLKIHHRRLPHWHQSSRLYFITFRLTDSIAQEKLKQWKEELEIWQQQQPDPEAKDTSSEVARMLRKRKQAWLDQGHGSCVLRTPEFARIIQEALLHFDQKRYNLGDYVIMPNHVHAIVAPVGGHTLSDILHSWKSYSAQQINRRLKKSGPLWTDESFDHIVRSEAYYKKFCAYIQSNPTKARLKPETYILGSGSLSLEESSLQAGMPAPRNIAPEDGQAGMPTPHTQNPNPVEQASLPAQTKHQNSVERASLPAQKRSYILRELAYTVLLHDVGKPPTACMGAGTDGQPRIRFDGHAQVSADMAEEILTRLKLPTKERKRIVEAIRGHMRFMDVQNMRKATLRRMIGAEIFDLELELHRLDCLGSHAMLDNYDFLHNTMEQMANEPVLPEPWINGRDLLQIGIKEGRLIGKILKEAYDAQMENRFSNREELLDWVRSSYSF